MDTRQLKELDQGAYIRAKIYAGHKSALRRYAELVVGDFNLPRLIKYELITTLFGPLPGALGLVLRRYFYRALFREVGKGTVFGRNVTVRHGHRISLGRGVIIDDDCLLDGRGAGEAGLRIGDETIINRHSAVQSKVGPIHIGAGVDVGAGSTLVSQGGVEVGDMVAIGGGCKIGGGVLQLEGTDDETGGTASDRHDFVDRGQRRYSRGAVHIGSRAVLGRGVIVMDAVRIGEDAMVSAGMVVREDVPSVSVLMPRERPVVMPREQFRRRETRNPAGTAVAPDAPVSGPAPASSPDMDVVALINRALETVNEQLPPERAIRLTPDAPLLEPDGPLDSMGIINLVVSTEEVIREETGVETNLTALITDGQNTASLASVGDFTAAVQRAVSATSATADQ